MAAVPYYDYITTNYPFNPPNSFVPRADHFVLTTEHSHLYDNSQISSIRLTGQTEGGLATYTATSNDGDWSDAASTVFQNYGDGLPGIALFQRILQFKLSPTLTAGRH